MDLLLGDLASMDLSPGDPGVAEEGQGWGLGQRRQGGGDGGWEEAVEVTKGR